jgi:uncharacterized PurR-regulated membrane protein YhhQ (DUF165 family)
LAFAATPVTAFGAQRVVASLCGYLVAKQANFSAFHKSDRVCWWREY